MKFKILLFVFIFYGSTSSSLYASAWNIFDCLKLADILLGKIDFKVPVGKPLSPEQKKEYEVLSYYHGMLNATWKNVIGVSLEEPRQWFKNAENYRRTLNESYYRSPDELFRNLTSSDERQMALNLARFFDIEVKVAVQNIVVNQKYFLAAEERDRKIQGKPRSKYKSHYQEAIERYEAHLKYKVPSLTIAFLAKRLANPKQTVGEFVANAVSAWDLLPPDISFAFLPLESYAAYNYYARILWPRNDFFAAIGFETEDKLLARYPKFKNAAYKNLDVVPDDIKAKLWKIIEYKDPALYRQIRERSPIDSEWKYQEMINRVFANMLREYSGTRLIHSVPGNYNINRVRLFYYANWFKAATKSGKSPDLVISHIDYLESVISAPSRN